MTDPTLYEARMRRSIAQACAVQDGAAFDQAIVEWGGDPVGPHSAVAIECLNQGSVWGFQRLRERGLPMNQQWVKKSFATISVMAAETISARQPYWELTALLMAEGAAVTDGGFVQLLTDLRTWLPGDAHRCGLVERFGGRWEEPFPSQLFGADDIGVLTPLQLAWAKGSPEVCAAMLEAGASFDALVLDSDMPQWSLLKAMEGKRLCGGIRNHAVRVLASSNEGNWGDRKGQPEWVALQAKVSRLAREKHLEQTLPAATRTPRVRF